MVQNIVLIGMPGAGKSTVGVVLAKALKRPFLDTDLVIQTREDRFLQEIIDTEGMEAFLDIEANAIRALRVDGHVIATGGSVVYRKEAMNHLQAHGTLVYLAVPDEDIAERLSNIATRGVAKRLDQSLQELFAERQPLYAQYADIMLDARGLTPEEIVTCLVERMW